jgi:hypothetical protein
MRVQIGPVDAGSVTMWVAYARTVLAQALSRPAEHRITVPPETIEGFERFLDQWQEVAERDTTFVWVAEVDPDEVEFLTHAWFSIAGALAAEADKRGFPLSPAEGDEFYQALIAGVLDALASEDRSRQEFSEQLRDEWPGLKEP